MKIYKQYELINHLSITKENDVVFLLGAGCSINSGCMSANKLVAEFKKRIYCAEKGINLNENTLFNDDEFINSINSELPSNMDNPYSYYFEKCFPDPKDRSKFIKHNFHNISPSYGYLCFAQYLIKNKIKVILTTNFDKLIEKSIKKVDESYDFTIKSDNLKPVLDSSLNIVNFHGDYNYDLLKNTESELSQLSEPLYEEIFDLKCKEIVIIGYSGADNSVMNFLNDISKKKKVKIIWCKISSHYNNPKIEELFTYNKESGYCLIEGFDELFAKLYTFQGENNEFINNFYKNIKSKEFELVIDNQPEHIVYNTNELTNNPRCYKIQQNLDFETIKEINNNNDMHVYIMEYKGFLYIVGDICKVKDFINIDDDKIKEVLICDENISIFNKCKLIKELLKIYFKTIGFKVFRDNVYIGSNQEIKEGIKLSIELFNGKICLITNVNYFSVSANITTNTKYKINHKKSGLYARINYEKRKELIQKIFGDNFKFNVYNTSVEFSNSIMGNIDHKSDVYNYIEEPEMVVNDNYISVNQIKILNDFGPKEIKFSQDTIKVGIFCVEEDKPKLKQYLDKMLNGTNSKAKDIIPEFKGFYNLFKKKIEIDYNGLPSFHIKQLLGNKPKKFDDFKDFCLRGIKKLYDEKNVDIVLVYISDKLNSFRKKDNLDLHDIIKLKCANSYKTQFLEEKTIDSSDDINKRIFNLSMGIYTKTIGMSWVPKNYSKDTLFVGMSFGIDSKGITVGCSQMFDGAGRGMKLIISQISDKKRKNQYLSHTEAYSLGIKIRQTYYKTSKTEELKRIVIHRNNPFKKEEIEGFKKAFEGLDDFALIQIGDYTQFNCYSIINGNCHGYPVKRGTTIKISKNAAYIWTDGSIVSTDILNGLTYRNNKRGMSSPIKITKYYGNISVNEVVKDLMYLTKMDFNSADVIYSKLPVTIKYSALMCEILKQGKLEDDQISFEYIM